MAITKADQLKIALNIIARVGSDGDLLGEYAKAISAIHGFSSQQQMSDMQKMALGSQNNAIGGTIPSQPMSSTPNDPNAVNMPQNEGNGSMNLPM